MEIKTYVCPFFAANCYLIKLSDYAIIIDPCYNYNDIKKDLNDLDIKYVFITHGHYDHFLMLESFLINTNCIVYMNDKCFKKLTDNSLNCSLQLGCTNMVDYEKYLGRFMFLNRVNNNIINDNEISLSSFETLGHTNCSLTYVIKETNDNEVEHWFTGDFLFSGSVGRSDLPTGNNIVLNNSLKMILNKYDSRIEYIIYPGHFSKTTLKNEISYNRYIHF